MPTQHAERASHIEKAYHKRLGPYAVINSNVTSSHFLGSARRSWMVDDEHNDSVQSQPGRRYSNPVSQRPKPQRSMTSLPAQPLVADSIIEVLSLADGPHASSEPATESTVASTTLEPRVHAQHEGTLEIERSGSSSRIRHCASVSNATSMSMELDSPLERAAGASIEGSMPRPIADPPGQSDHSAISTESVQTISTFQQGGNTHQGEVVQSPNPVDLDGIELFPDADQPAQNQELSGAPSTTERQDEMPQITGNTAGNDGIDRLTAEMLAPRGDIALITSIPEPHTPTTDQEAPPSVTSPDLVVLGSSSNQQGTPAVGNATHALPQYHFASVSTTPSAHAGHLEGSRKRSADRGLSAERRTRTRASGDATNFPVQLPTPQDSPIASTATLSGHFESQLAAVFNRPLTTDLEPVIDSYRIEMVREACRRDDQFFLLTHAVLCVLSASQVGILSLLQFTERHLQGLQVLTSVLGSNRRVSTELFAMFINFPQRLEEIVQRQTHEFKVLVEEVRCFLFHLASGFHSVRDASLKRSCPPCPAELKFSLKLPSPVLQKALLTSILRERETDPGFLSMSLSLFEREMSNPAGSAISIQELNAYHGSQLPPIVARWAVSYGQSRKQYEKMNKVQQMQTPRPQQLPATGSGQRGGQLIMPNSPQVPIPPNTPSQARGFNPPTHPAPPATVHHFSPMTHQSVPPHLQQQFHPLPPHPLPPVSPGIHQQGSYSVHPQFQHEPYWNHSPGFVPNGAAVPPSPFTQMTVSRPVQQSPSGLANQPPPTRYTQAAPNPPTNFPMGRTDVSPRCLSHSQQSGTSRDVWAPVAEIVEKRAVGGRTLFRVRWKGNSTPQESWLTKSRIRDVRGALVGLRTEPPVHDRNDPQRGSYAPALPQPTNQAMQFVPNPYSMPSVIVQQQIASNQQLAATSRPTLQQRSRSQTPTNAVSSNAGMPPSHHGIDHGLVQVVPAASLSHGTASHLQGHLHQPGTPEPSPLFFWRDANVNVPQAAVPAPERFALHQAQLNSPEYHPMTESDGNKMDTRYYQYVEDIIELPQLVTQDSDLIRWQVRIPPEIWLRRTITLPAIGEFSVEQRNVSDGDAQFRLKSIVLDGQDRQSPPTLSEFCAHPVKWPKFLSVTINGDAGIVDFRRKAHFGVDLATDVTELLREGDNEIVVGAIFNSEESESRFLLAVEVVCVADHNRLLKLPTRISAVDSLAAITNSLKTQDDGDDDLIIEQRVMSIDLMDPFMSVIWETPVRGKSCAHRECFDLSAFLLSRTSRVTESGLTSPDKWHCPICKSDCRPPMLVIDEFLLEVRNTLAKNDQLHAKAILVQEDGSWEPKLHPASPKNVQDTPDPDTPAIEISVPVVTESKTEGHFGPVPPPAPATSGTSTPRPRTDQSTIIILDDED